MSLNQRREENDLAGSLVSSRSYINSNDTSVVHGSALIKSCLSNWLLVVILHHNCYGITVDSAFRMDKKKLAMMFNADDDDAPPFQVTPHPVLHPALHEH